MKKINIQYPDGTIHNINVYAINRTKNGYYIMNYQDIGTNGRLNSLPVNGSIPIVNNNGFWEKSMEHFPNDESDVVYDPKFSDWFINNYVSEENFFNILIKNRNIKVASSAPPGGGDPPPPNDNYKYSIFERLSDDAKSLPFMLPSGFKVVVVQHNNINNSLNKDIVFIGDLEGINIESENNYINLANVDFLESDSKIFDQIRTLISSKFSNSDVDFGINKDSLLSGLDIKYVNCENEQLFKSLKMSSNLNIPIYKTDYNLKNVFEECLNFKRSFYAVNQDGRVYSNESYLDSSKKISR